MLGVLLPVADTMQAHTFEPRVVNLLITVSTGVQTTVPCGYLSKPGHD